MSSDALPGPPPSEPLRTPLTVGDWRVDPTTDAIARGDRVEKLEPRAMALLLALAERPGQVLSIETLMRQVWPGVVVTPNSVYQAITSLRRTLGDDPDDPRYIATVARKGYRLVAPVGSDTLVVVPSARRRWIVAVGAGAAVAGLGGVAWHLGRSPRFELPVRVTVLPFTEVQGAGVAEGLAGDVIRTLERRDDVLVTARESARLVAQAGDEAALLDRVRERLQADVALLGTLARTTDTVRVAVRLMRLARPAELWSAPIEKPLDRLAEMPWLLARGVIEAVGLESRGPPVVESLTAYELYLLGMAHLTKPKGSDDVDRARGFLERAIDRDPAYARAYVGLAVAWLNLANLDAGLSYPQAAARAQPLVDKALTLQPDLVDALVAQGGIHRWTGDPERGRQILQRAVELAPGDAVARRELALLLFWQDRTRATLDHLARAADGDPLNVRIAESRAIVAIYANDLALATAQKARVETLNPQSQLREAIAQTASFAAGRIDEAVVPLRAWLARDPRALGIHVDLVPLYMDLGMFDAVAASLATLKGVKGREAYADIYGAALLVAAGRRDALPAHLAAIGFDRPLARPLDDTDRVTLQALAGRMPDPGVLDGLVKAMHAADRPWANARQAFKGSHPPLELAMLYRMIGRDADADALLAEVDGLLKRWRDDGNAFHMLDFHAARVAAHRGDATGAAGHLAEAFRRGWRRAWLFAFDPLIDRFRDHPAIADVLAKVADDMRAQRDRLADHG